MALVACATRYGCWQCCNSFRSVRRSRPFGCAPVATSRLCRTQPGRHRGARSGPTSVPDRRTVLRQEIHRPALVTVEVAEIRAPRRLRNSWNGTTRPAARRRQRIRERLQSCPRRPRRPRRPRTSRPSSAQRSRRLIQPNEHGARHVRQPNVPCREAAAAPGTERQQVNDEQVTTRCGHLFNGLLGSARHTRAARRMNERRLRGGERRSTSKG